MDALQSSIPHEQLLSANITAESAQIGAFGIVRQASSKGCGVRGKHRPPPGHRVNEICYLVFSRKLSGNTRAIAADSLHQDGSQMRGGEPRTVRPSAELKWFSRDFKDAGPATGLVFSVNSLSM